MSKEKKCIEVGLGVERHKMVLGLGMEHNQWIVSDFFEQFYLLIIALQFGVLAQFIDCLFSINIHDRKLAFMFGIGFILYLIFILFNLNFTAKVPKREGIHWGYNLNKIANKLNNTDSGKEEKIIIEKVQNKRARKNNMVKLLDILLICYFVNLMILGSNQLSIYVFSAIIIAILFINLWLRFYFSKLIIHFGKLADDFESNDE